MSIMTEFRPRPSRRSVLGAGAAGAALLATPSIVLAQGQPIRIASLTPLTGAGGAYGPRMRDAIAAVVNEVNAAGGVRGRQVQLVTEDDQTNPEAAVRAARKLVDVDRVSAIMGTWASSVTSVRTNAQRVPIAASTARPSASRRPATITCAPSAANTSAVRRPMPLVAPVTMQTLS